MIIRTEIFYFSDEDRLKSIEIAKLIKGYVDIEDGRKENPHIDINPFHNIILIYPNSYLDFIINKYNLLNLNKRLFLLSDKVDNRFNNLDLDVNNDAFLINTI